MHPKLYLKNKNEFEKYKNIIKTFSCPFCRALETLVLYGPYKDKGHRCLCSNRFNKKGCGKTFSFLWGNVIKNHIVKTNDLWKFLIKLLLHKNITKSLLLSRIHFSRRAVNHWLKKLKLCQSTIRYNLIRITSPPSISVTSPLLQTIYHLKNCFPECCAIESYQTHFQRSIFEK